MNEFFSFYFLLVPPERPIIYETKRREKAKNVEAYNEGTDVVLICEVSGGMYNDPDFMFEMKYFLFFI